MAYGIYMVNLYFLITNIISGTVSFSEIAPVLLALPALLYEKKFKRFRML